MQLDRIVTKIRIADRFTSSALSKAASVHELCCLSPLLQKFDIKDLPRAIYNLAEQHSFKT
jgi:hypothetical protein